MPLDLILPLGILMALGAWTLIFAWYIHPRLRDKPFAEAIRPLLLLHTFRYIGLLFLIPGVTAEVLDTRFSWPAAYGDLVAAVLAFAALGALRLQPRWAIGAVAFFNVFGFADLLNAVARGLAFNSDGGLGATIWIPAVAVPLLLVSHVYIFGRVYREIQARHSDAARLTPAAGT
ncbi:MAG: hypothetical protein ACN4GT_05630 [Gammaproteobacteria bacterium]